MKRVFPTLLNRRAKIFGSMNRSDLTVLGVSYLLLSLLKISGIFSLVLIASILFTFKLLTKKLPKGFFRDLLINRELNWSYKLEKFHE